MAVSNLERPVLADVEIGRGYRDRALSGELAHGLYISRLFIDERGLDVA